MVGGVSPMPLRVAVADTTPWVVVETVSVAVAVPLARGVKINCTVHVLPAATLAPQVVVPTAKLAAPEPEIEKPGVPRGDPPEFVMVSVALPLVFTCRLPKVKVVG